MRANVVALLGGLGNQLHQAAFGALLEDETGGETAFDVSCRRHLELDVLEVPEVGDFVRRRILADTRYLPAPDGRVGPVGRLVRRACGPGRIVRDYSGTGPEVDSCPEPAWWFGYWQRLQYANPLLPPLRASLRGSNEAEPILGVSVRRGDMLRTPTATPSEWYRRGVDALRDRLGALPPIRVWSNDLAWCRDRLDLGVPFETAAPGTALEHMAQLARSSALVIPRSSFSWWAATLAGDVPVVYPGPWWPGLDAEDETVVPDHWIRVPVELKRRDGNA